jgi:dipeptidyl aminopeptidase/acylaminoacyl peptidase
MALGALLAPAWARAAETAPSPATIPVEVFTSLADMDEPRLSPSGDAVAILVKNTAGRRQLAILDTQDFTHAKVVASFADADVARVHWADNQRLIYSVWSQQESAWDSVGYLRLAVDRDGEHPLWLAGRGLNSLAVKAARDGLEEFVRTLDDGTGEVIAAEWSWTDIRGYGNHRIDSTPKRYDTRRGVATSLLHGRIPHDIQEWIVDEQGNVRGGLSHSGNRTALLSPDEKGDWLERARFPIWGKSSNSFEVVGLATDGQLYVRHTPGRASHGLYRMDIQTGTIEPNPVVDAPGFDLDPVLIEDRKLHKVIGVRYVTDAEGTVWFDAGMKAVQAKVDARLPGLINRLNPATCGCARRVLVTSFSDRQPAIFYLYDREDDSLVRIASSRPRVDPRQSATTDFFRIKARDGHDLPV